VTGWLVLVKYAGLKRGKKLFVNGATGAVGHAAMAIAREIGAEVTGRVGPQSIAQARSLGLSHALDDTKLQPRPATEPTLNRLAALWATEPTCCSAAPTIEPCRCIPPA